MTTVASNPRSIKRYVVLASIAAVAALSALLPSQAQASVRVYKNSATSFCLDSNARGKVYTHACNGGKFQRWNVTGGSIVQLKNVRTGRCLDSNTRRQVYTLPCNGGNFQHWRVFYNRNGTRTFRNVSTKFCLDSNTRRLVYTHGCNKGAFQKWSRG